MSMRSSRAPLWAIAAGCVALLFGLAGGFALGLNGGGAGAAPEQAGPQGGGGPPPAMVKVDTARMEPLSQRVLVTGRLREVRRVTATAEVAGKLIEVNVQEGDRVVGRETVMVRVDPVWADLRLASSEATLAEARANLNQSENDLAQLEHLRSQGTAKQKEVDDARTAVAADRARLAAAEAELSRAQVERERLAVLAPFDAQVTRKLAEVGQWVEPGDGVVELVSVGTIDAEVNVPEAAVAAVAQLSAEGTPIVVTIDALRVGGEATRAELTGTIASITPDGSSASRTFPVKVRLEDPEALLKPGMSVTALFPVGSPRPTLTVPRDAVVFSTLTPQVWVAMDAKAGDDTPGVAEAPPPFALPASVRVLYGQGDRFAIEVLDGPLFPGATVVVEGGESLFPTRPLLFESGGPADATAQQPHGKDPA